MSEYAAAVTGDGADTLVRVRLVPRAKQPGLAGTHGAALKLRVSAPPAQGRANTEAPGMLAEVLGVRARDLALVAGARSRDKVVRVPGVAPADVVRALEGA